MAGTAVGVGVTDRVAAGTIAKWIKDVSDIAEHKMALLPILRKKGRVVDYDGGAEMRWVFRYKYHELRGHVDARANAASRLQPYLNFAVPFGYYEMDDAATPQEIIENGGDAAIVKIFDQKMIGLQDSFAQQIARQFYNDNSVAQATIPNPLHGFESFCSVGAQTATELFQTSSDDTYAGQSTSRTGLKADATIVDEEYGCTTPVIVNGNQTVNGSAVAWADNADEYLARGLQKAQITSDADDRVDVVLLNQDYWGEFLALMRDKERKMLSPEYSESSYGFAPGQAVQHEGALINWDFAIPATDADGFAVIGYGFNTSKMKLHVRSAIPGWTRPKDSLAMFREFIDPPTSAVWWKLLNAMQLEFKSPKYFLKFSKFAA